MIKQLAFQQEASVFCHSPQSNIKSAEEGSHFNRGEGGQLFGTFSTLPLELKPKSHYFPTAYQSRVCWCSSRRPNHSLQQFPVAVPASWTMTKWQSPERSWMWNLTPMPNLSWVFKFFFFFKISIQNMLSLAASPEDCEVMMHKWSNSYLCRMVKQTQDLQIVAVVRQGLWAAETRRHTGRAHTHAKGSRSDPSASCHQARGQGYLFSSNHSKSLLHFSGSLVFF